MKTARFFLVLSVAMLGRPLLASPLLETTGEFSGLAGQLARVEADSAAAVYFNPALLSLLPAQFQSGLLLLGGHYSIKLNSRPAGVDVPESIFRARRLLPDGSSARLQLRPLPTAQLRNARGASDPSQTLGFFELGTVMAFGKRQLVTFGFYALIPAGDFQAQSPSFPDEREQYFSNSLHFERYGDRLLGSVFSMALATRPWSWLSVGMGVRLANSTEARTEVFRPDASSQEDSLTLSHVKVHMKAVPHFGLVLEPWSRLRLTFTAHLPLRNRVQGKGELQFWNYEYPEGQDVLYQPLSFAHGHLPWRLSAGATYRFGADGRSGWLSAGLLWAQWSDYLNRVFEKPLDGWSDTLEATLGGGLRRGAHTFSLQLGYAPSPVPEQSGRTNYVDNDRAFAGAGYRWDFQLKERRLALTAGLQVQHLIYRRATKRADAAHPVIDEFPDSIDIATGQFIPESTGLQTNNPGYPGFNSLGWIWVGGLALRYCH